MAACLFWGSDRNCTVELPALAPVHGGNGLTIEPRAWATWADGRGQRGGVTQRGVCPLQNPANDFLSCPRSETTYTLHSVACDGNVTARMGHMGELGCRLGAALAKQGG